MCDVEQIAYVLKATPHGAQVRNRLLPHCFAVKIRAFNASDISQCPTDSGVICVSSA